MGAAAFGALSISAVWAQTPMVPSTRDFITAAAQSDRFEMLEGRTAATQTHDGRIRIFAEEMVQAHTKTSKALQQAAMSAGMDGLPKGLSGDQERLLGALQSLKGPEFDRTYAKQQVLAHQEALVVEQAYATQGDNLAVRQAARSAVPLQHHHHAEAEPQRTELAER